MQGGCVESDKKGCKKGHEKKNLGAERGGVRKKGSGVRKKESEKDTNKPSVKEKARQKEGGVTTIASKTGRRLWKRRDRHHTK